MYLVDGTVKTVWIRQVFDYSGFGSDRFNCILGGSRIVNVQMSTMKNNYKS